MIFDKFLKMLSRVNANPSSSLGLRHLAFAMNARFGVCVLGTFASDWWAKTPKSQEHRLGSRQLSIEQSEALIISLAGIVMRSQISLDPRSSSVISQLNQNWLASHQHGLGVLGGFA